MTNNHASFHLLWKENLLNRQLYLLTALIVENNHISSAIYFIFLKKVLDQTWKAFNIKY